MHVDAAIVERDRRRPSRPCACAKSRSVCAPAAALRVIDHRGGELAAIEGFAVGSRAIISSVRAIAALAKQLARGAGRGHAAGSARTSRGRCGMCGTRSCHFSRDDRRDREPVARIADRGLEQIARRAARRSAATARAQPDTAPGNRDRVPAALGHASTAGKAPGCHAAGARPEALSPTSSLPVHTIAKRSRADAVAARLDDRQRDRGGQRRVDGVAAAREHRDARLRGERLRGRDDVAGEERLPPRGVGQRTSRGAACDVGHACERTRPARAAVIRGTPLRASCGSTGATTMSQECTASASIDGRHRPRDEHGGIAARQQQRAAQVLLHHRSEDEAEQQRRRLAFELDEDPAEDAEQHRHDRRRRRCSGGCTRRCSRTAGCAG